MEMRTIVAVVLIVVFIVVFIRILREDQRVTTYLFGRWFSIKGPGLVLWVPLLNQRWRKHSRGDRGNMVGANGAESQGAIVPVKLDAGTATADTVAIVGYDGVQSKTIFVIRPYGSA